MQYSLALEVENLDRASSGSAEPVPIGREHKSIDHVACLKGIQVLGIVEVPEHSDTVLAA